MTNQTLNVPVLTQLPINVIKEPFREAMTEASGKPADYKDPVETASNTFAKPDSTIVTLSQMLLPKFDPSEITDQELLKLCQQYGNDSKAWKRKFEELLPEVLKRHLYKKHRFVSIYEFSAKLCGLSRDSVDNVIRIYRQLEDMPMLRSLVVEFGWSKLRIVSGIATPETDASWAEKVRVLPKDSLEVFVRDLKRQEEKEKIEKLMNDKVPQNIADLPYNQLQLTDRKIELDNESSTSQIFPWENLTETPLVARFSHPNLLTSLTRKISLNPMMPFSASFGAPTLTNSPDNYENSWSTASFKLSPETHFRLRKLKARIEKGKKEKIGFNQLFETMLDVIENKEKVVKKSRSPYGMVPLKLCKV